MRIQPWRTLKRKGTNDGAFWASTSQGRRQAVNFAGFFDKATGNLPYAYQCRLACGQEADPDKTETLMRGSECGSLLINIPTGLGKTAAVVFAWLWNRVQLQNPKWPRRR